ncbi:hypothetical protein [Yersinia kristensenii]|uniref:hypothetical protein n=1 Tax=Yersinia kristensenii TaxID=28152 RepID=UPI0011A6B3E2|nr:hypothetical protein [Yersinia kristensenii]
MLSEEYLKEVINSPANELTIALATELLSLREQLAELKALPPIGQIVLSDYDSDGTRTARVACLHDQADWDNFQDGTLLYLEAKPAEDSEIAKFMAGVKNSMVKEVAEVIQKEALLIMFDEITPDTETIAMQYESLVKRINCPED